MLLFTIVLKNIKSVVISLKNEWYLCGGKLSRDSVDQPWLVLYSVLPGSHVLYIHMGKNQKNFSFWT